MDLDPSRQSFSSEGFVSQEAFNNGVSPLGRTHGLGRVGFPQLPGFNSLPALLESAVYPAMQVIFWTLVTIGVTMLPLGWGTGGTITGMAQAATTSAAQLMTGTWLAGLIVITMMWSLHQAWANAVHMRERWLWQHFPAKRGSAMARQRGTQVFRRSYTQSRELLVRCKALFCALMAMPQLASRTIRLPQW